MKTNNKPVHKLMGLNITDDYKFLVVGAFCWGIGSTIEEACKNASVNGDSSKAYCVIVPDKIKDLEWRICDVTGGVSVIQKPYKGWDVTKDKVIAQLWNKHFHVGTTQRGKINKWGFGLFDK